MKIEKLTENKIRIILSIEDLKANNVDLHSFMANAIESQSFFVTMLNQAEKEVGFTTKDCKLLIEAIASSEGDFIFVITKYHNESGIKDSTKKKKLNIKRKTNDLNIEKAIYSFPSFEEFCHFCAYLSSSNLKDLKNFSKNISLHLYKNTYYLVISNINLKFPKLKSFYASISEFAKLVTHSEHFEGKLLEHGKVIMKKDAIKKGIQFFVKDNK